MSQETVAAWYGGTFRFVSCVGNKKSVAELALVLMTEEVTTDKTLWQK